MNAAIRVTVTGAAGQIGYASIFRIAAGDMFGPDQPVILQLLEIPAAMQTLEGLAMELEDSAFPLLDGVVLTDDPNIAFDGTNWALLVGSRPRQQGMERRDLLGINAPIFSVQGRALNAHAADDVRIVVVGNPANTNCLIAMQNAPDIPAERFTAMTRLDHNRAKSLLARKAGVSVADVSRLAIWGNHSPTQYPDAHHAFIGDRPATEIIRDHAWLDQEFIPTVQQRGTAVIQVAGKSSAASAANALLGHVRDWSNGTPENDWVSMAVPSRGEYGLPKGIVCSFPVTVRQGAWHVVEGLDLDHEDRAHIEASAAELMAERDAVAEMTAAQ